MVEKEEIVKGLKVNYKVFGSKGVPFLILHGWGSKSDRWESVGELLSKKGLMVVVPDLPGFGKSDTLKEAWCIDDYVDWVNEFINTFPEFKEEFYLLGHSFGGTVSIKFSIKYAQKVKKLFLFGAAAIRKKTIKKQVLGTVSKFVKVFSFLPFYKLAKRAFYKFVVGPTDYLRVDGVMKQTFLKVISQDLSQHVSFLKVPTVIIWGDKDDTTLVEDAYFMNKKIDGSKLEIVEGADHDMEQVMPEALVQRVLNNLNTEIFSPNDINL